MDKVRWIVDDPPPPRAARVGRRWAAAIATDLLLAAMARRPPPLDDATEALRRVVSTDPTCWGSWRRLADLWTRPARPADDRPAFERKRVIDRAAGDEAVRAQQRERRVFDLARNRFLPAPQGGLDGALPPVVLRDAPSFESIDATKVRSPTTVTRSSTSLGTFLCRREAS